MHGETALCTIIQNMLYDATGELYMRYMLKQDYIRCTYLNKFVCLILELLSFKKLSMRGAVHNDVLLLVHDVLLLVSVQSPDPLYG